MSKLYTYKIASFPFSLILKVFKKVWEKPKHERQGKGAASIVAFMPVFRKIKLEYEEEVEGEIIKVNKKKIAMFSNSKGDSKWK